MEEEFDDKKSAVKNRINSKQEQKREKFDEEHY